MDAKNVLLTALKYYGQQAISGDITNQVIEQFYKEAGHKNIKGDDIAWCSAFLDAVFTESGHPVPASLLARSWLEIGTSTDKPEQGDVVVFWREDINGWKGHVGLYINKIGSMIYCLGGNQQNMVSIHPYSDAFVLGYRKVAIEM